ncbi:hypothetical protein NDU88_006720 [Pleurodeles waltl]|uniref:Uncharacterized protein n=1 Tax=Pleurodeles waltl TaxID=8319 RepID=A0AAV7VMP8_PLEWA|nr:hypothetical protein NDU88_006720 [Pleurodeles waltl]
MPLSQSRLHFCFRGAPGVTSSAAGAPLHLCCHPAAEHRVRRQFGSRGPGGSHSAAHRLPRSLPAPFSGSLASSLLTTDRFHCCPGGAPGVTSLSSGAPSALLPPTHARAPAGATILGTEHPQDARLTLPRPLGPQPLPSPFSDSLSSLPPGGPQAGGRRRDTGLRLTCLPF